MMVVDGHCHVTPVGFPPAPSEAAAPRWPCMRHHDAHNATMMMGDMAFRELDLRSWDVDRRIEDMDRDGIAMQVVSPMPELLSYWMTPEDAAIVCDASNAQIADMIARAPHRFRGLGAVPMQDPARAAAALGRLRTTFGLSGVEIGSNIDGVMLGDARFDPFWAAAQDEGLAVFVHALHPIAAKPLAANPPFTAFALFPVDVAMAAASLAMAGVADRFPRLRIGFSHGGGALAAILGRLDIGWEATAGFTDRAVRRPSEQARGFFYDSNVYDPSFLRHLTDAAVPGQVFMGTDYPYQIMQPDPVAYLRSAGLSDRALADLASGAIGRFLGEELDTALT